MQIIRLSEDVISKIAAGEVIERPAYALKELIENAIDAQATRILIEIKSAGLEEIRIKDNGIGMTKEDLLLSFCAHTTSKIKSAEDIEHLSSLGFRGEALASIAAISQMTIQSRPLQADVGFQVITDQGQIQEEGPLGMPIGTIITVKDLFTSVPARKSFLKSTQTELRHCALIVSTLALAYPEIEFKLIHHKKILLDFPKVINQAERILSVVGQDIGSQLVAIRHENPYMQLDGFIGKPHLTSGSLKSFLFINGRKVSDHLVASAVKDAYGTLLEQSATPFSILFLTLPPETIDVNIHPKKETVLFLHQESIYESIKTAVLETLTSHNLTYANVSFLSPSSRSYSTTTNLASKLKETVLPWQPLDTQEQEYSQVFQLDDTYILAATAQGVLLVDQHAAHERILYNQFHDAASQHVQAVETITMTPSEVISLPVPEVLLLSEHLSFFASIGLELELFDSNSIRVNKIPSVFKDVAPHELISLFLQELEVGKNKPTTEKMLHRMLSTLACKAAIKAGDPLSQSECIRLLQKLDTQPQSFSCPHGRPTKIIISIAQLEKMFKRR